MTIERVKAAAWLRGIYFDGVKQYRNSTVGAAYEVRTYRGTFQADTLNGLYKYIMTFKKVGDQ